MSATGEILITSGNVLMLTVVLDLSILDITAIRPLECEDSSKNWLTHRCLPIPDTRTGHRVRIRNCFACIRIYRLTFLIHVYSTMTLIRVCVHYANT